MTETSFSREIEAELAKYLTRANFFKRAVLNFKDSFKSLTTLRSAVCSAPEAAESALKAGVSINDFNQALSEKFVQAFDI